jgi:hypothetical protein
MEHTTHSSNLADLLERILDKGLVITGDIKVNLVEIELLSIQIRLLICSADKAKELGVDWWSQKTINTQHQTQLEETIARLEAQVAALQNAETCKPT